MPPPCQRLWGGTSGASEKVATRWTPGAVRRDLWDQSDSFVHSADMTVVIGVHTCCGGRGGYSKGKLLCCSLDRVKWR